MKHSTPSGRYSGCSGRAEEPHMTNFRLKPLSEKSVEAALRKAEHYRLLNEPRQAESICLDIVEVQP